MRLSPTATAVSLAAGALLAPMADVSAQQPVLEISESTLVARAMEGEVLVEPAVAVHPTDPNHLLAVAWLHPAGSDDVDLRTERCATFLSLDGGRTWEGGELGGMSCADPWVTLTEKGAILTAMGQHPRLPVSEVQLMAYFSADGGRTWHDVPQSLGWNHDGPRTVAGTDGTVYLASGQAWRDADGNLRYSVLVGRSPRGAPHIDTVARLLPSNLNLNPDGLAVLSDGALVITYDDYQRKVNGTFRPRTGVLERRRSWAVVSENGGQSFSIPLFITESCWDRPTSLAADTSSGPFRDHLYYVCAGDEGRSILLTHSIDRGEEWSDATPIETPASRQGSRRQPQVAVNAEGIVAVAWMDRRDDSTASCYAPYVAVSADGGETFSAPARLADEVSCPDQDRLGFPGRRWPLGGDYFGFTAGTDGRFHVVWSDARDGTFDLRAATVTVNREPRD